MKVIFIALAMLILPAPVSAQETGMLVAQAGVDNRPVTQDNFYRLDGKIEDVRRDLGGRIDAQGRDLGGRIDARGRDLGARIDAQRRHLSGRIDSLTTAVWTLLGVIVAAFLAGLLGIVAVLIPALIRREKGSGDSASLSPDAPASASR